MKQLNEFATLADAQAYTYVDEKMVSPDMVISLLTLYDSTLTLDSASFTDPKAKGFLMALQGSVTEFNVMNSHPVGQVQQSILAHLVSIGAVTQDFSDNLIGYANQTKRPYLNTTQEEFNLAQQEELTLSDSTSDTIYQLEFTNNPVGVAQVKIMQQYGPNESDLTEWHPIANFHNVKYKQDEYKVRVPATNQAIRKLKVVSNQTIGMTVQAI